MSSEIVATLPPRTHGPAQNRPPLLDAWYGAERYFKHRESCFFSLKDVRIAAENLGAEWVRARFDSTEGAVIVDVMPASLAPQLEEELHYRYVPITTRVRVVGARRAGPHDRAALAVLSLETAMRVNIELDRGEPASAVVCEDGAVFEFRRVEGTLQP